EVCRREKVDLVFAPSVEVMYPRPFRTFVEVKEFHEVLCGASRPGHFRGVATVVLKLFNIVRPDVAFFGQKDAQQCRVIQQMIRDLELSIDLRICPIVREPDGLAVSSRNRYLDPQQRRQATILFRVLEEARKWIDGGERNAARVRGLMASRIESTP